MGEYAEEAVCEAISNGESMLPSHLDRGDDEKFFYCDCGYSLKDNSTFVHDVICPECREYFLDGNIQLLTKAEFNEATHS